MLRLIPSFFLIFFFFFFLFFTCFTLKALHGSTILMHPCDMHNCKCSFFATRPIVCEPILLRVIDERRVHFTDPLAWIKSQRPRYLRGIPKLSLMNRGSSECFFVIGEVDRFLMINKEFWRVLKRSKSISNKMKGRNNACDFVARFWGLINGILLK